MTVSKVGTDYEMEKDELIRQALEQFAQAKEEFCEAHREGTAALERGDFGAVLEAIAAECDAIEKQRAATRRLTGVRGILDPLSHERTHLQAPRPEVPQVGSSNLTSLVRPNYN